MKELWYKARQYGLVRLSTLKDGDYYCCIEFATVGGIKLEAASDFKCKTPAEALEKAIAKAEEVINGFKVLGASHEGKLSAIEDHQVSSVTRMVCSQSSDSK